MTIEDTDPVIRWMYWLGVVPALVLLGVVLSQPVWNSKHLIQQVTSDCKQRHGVLIIDHGLFGDTYW